MPFNDDRRYSFERVSWGITPCKLLVCEDGSPCPRDAELLYDLLEHRGIPACSDCADAMLERTQLLAERPELAVTLGPLTPW